MSSTIRLYLFGSLRIESVAGPFRLPTHKVEALLAYLALHPEPHAREKLAGMLWGESTDALARASLRNAVAMLRKHLSGEALLGDRETVQLNPDNRLWVDAVVFRDQASQYLHGRLPEAKRPRPSTFIRVACWPISTTTGSSRRAISFAVCIGVPCCG